MLALASGSIAFAQVPLEPLIPADSALKRAAHPLLGGGDTVTETVKFKSGSAWHLTLNTRDLNFPGLIITDASFQKSPELPFLYILFDGRLAEIFVPYHNDLHRFRDISGFTHFEMLKLDPTKFPLPPGVKPAVNPKDDVRQIIGSDENICKEVRDYLAWMQDDAVRYGYQLPYRQVALSRDK